MSNISQHTHYKSWITHKTAHRTSQITHHKLHITLKQSFYHSQEPSFFKQYHFLPIRNTSRGKDMPSLKTPVRKKETVNTHATTFRKY